MAVILVIENAPDVREPMAAWLRCEGHEVHAVGDGRAAMRWLRQERADIVIAALDTPLIDAVTMLTTLRNRHGLAALPALLLLRGQHSAYTPLLRKLAPADFIFREEFTRSAVLSKISTLLGVAAQADRCASDSPHPSEAPIEVADPSAEIATDDAGEHPAETDLNIEPLAAPAASGGEASPGPAQGQESAPMDPPLRPAPQDLRSLRPIRKRREIEELIDEFSDLSAMPPAVARVVKITNNPDCSIDVVVRAIRQDQALALKVLRLANSAAYARGDAVDSVQTAVMRIGLSQIRQTALSIAVIDRFAQTQPAASVHPAAFWQHSIACGVIAAELASACEVSAEDAFTMGLLHDVGRMVLAEQLGAEYGEVVETARALGAPLHIVEKKMLIMDHAKATERLLRAWRFPKDLIACVGAHHGSVSEIRSACKEQRTIGLILALADRFAHAMMLGASGDETLTPAREFCETLSLTPETVSAILERAEEQADDIKFGLLADAHGEGAWPDERQRWSPHMPEDFRPLHIGGPGAFDTLAIFSRRAKPEEPGPRTIAIAHLEKPADGPALRGKLDDAEAFSGGERLPLIVVAPEPAAALDPAIERDRRVIRLPLPAPIQQFVDGVNQCLATREAAA